LGVGADVLPDGAPREILYNVISDAACAVVVSRGCREDQWLGFTEFVNLYERTKWEAEQLTVAAALPVRIARLSTCIGGERTGSVHRVEERPDRGSNHRRRSYVRAF